MIDRLAIFTKFRDIASQRVGSYLTSIGGSPAVIPARTTKARPAYPYITVDMIELKQNWQDDNSYIDENEHQVHEMTKTLMVMYQYYGGYTWSDNANSAQWVMNELKNCFQFESVIGDVEKTVNCTPSLTTDIQDYNVRVADGYIESASFNVLVEVVDSASDTDPFVFDSISFTGEAWPAGEDEYIEIDFTVTNP